MAKRSPTVEINFLDSMMLLKNWFVQTVCLSVTIISCSAIVFFKIPTAVQFKVLCPRYDWFSKILRNSQHKWLKLSLSPLASIRSIQISDSYDSFHFPKQIFWHSFNSSASLSFSAVVSFRRMFNEAFFFLANVISFIYCTKIWSSWPGNSKSALLHVEYMIVQFAFCTELKKKNNNKIK